jgi:predicted GTPase
LQKQINIPRINLLMEANMTLQTGADAHDGREVFISYRTLDDMPPPDRRMSHGFVNYLLRQVRARLQEMGVPDAVLWQDRSKIEPGDVWSDKLF